MSQSAHMALATFGAGCFWGVEAAFRGLKTEVGYTGGTTEQPSYQQICSGRTGHTEAVRIVFDPKRVSYKRLLEVFWSCHDPTQFSRPDIGTQYRSVIFYHTAQQKREAEQSKKEEQKKHKNPIATLILPAKTFWRAEEYHQRYVEKHGKVC